MHTTMTTMALDALKFGHESRQHLNPRANGNTNGRDTDIESLAASIVAHGLIQPLTVCVAKGDGSGKIVEGAVYVVDGNRRLAALRLLAEQGHFGIEYQVPVVVIDEGPRPEEISLAANTLRVALHPADAYTAFARLAADGLDADAIARRFGEKPPAVAQILALGNLAPVIVEAWRAGRLGRDADEIVQLFTLADVTEQERVFALLTMDGVPVWANLVRRELGLNAHEARKHIAFVGIEAYRAAGGALHEDLFGDEHRLDDPALAKRLADEKLQAECARLTAPPPDGEGWAWAAFEDDLPEGARWTWQKLKGAAKPTEEEKARLAELRAIMRAVDEGPLGDEEQRDAAADLAEEAEAEFNRIEEALRARAFGEKERAKAGCVLSLDHSGQLEIRTGIVRPDTAKKSKGAASPAAKKKAATRGDPFAVSQALQGRLDGQLTKAVAASLPARPNVALAAILAVHRSGGDGPFQLNIGMHSSGNSGGFAAEFTTLALGADALIEAGAAMAAVLVQLGCRELDDADSDGRMLVAAMDQDVLRAELRRAFDPADYFASVPKTLLLAAIGEALHADQAKALEKKKRDEIASFAITHVPQTGWLPPQLRAVAGCAGGGGAGVGGDSRSASDEPAAKRATKPKAKAKRAVKAKPKARGKAKRPPKTQRKAA